MKVDLSWLLVTQNFLDLVVGRLEARDEIRATAVRKISCDHSSQHVIIDAVPADPMTDAGD